jgi:hypothetical protein
VTLAGCIRFLIEDGQDEDPDGSVTLDEVLMVLKGLQP